jgi:phosphoserine phosphatase RsbU/P
MGDPRGAGRQRLRNITAVFALATAAAAPAWAQMTVARPALNPRSVDGTTMGEPVNLGSMWLAKQGDDPRWAEPGYDDSAWQVVNTGVPLVQQGMKDVNAIWFRTHVRVPPSARHLAIMLTVMQGGNEIFVNGQRCGGQGSMTGEGTDNLWSEYVAVPDSALGRPDLIIAIRARVGLASHHGDTPFAGITMETLPMLGPAQEVRDLLTLTLFRDFTSNATNLTLVLIVLLITLALALAARDEREYAVLATALATQAAAQVLTLCHFVGGAPRTPVSNFVDLALDAAYALALVEFVRIVLGMKRSLWFTVYYWLLLLWPVVGTFRMSYWVPRHAIDDGVAVGLTVIAEILSAPATLGLPILALWVAWRKRNADAWLLFVPLLVGASGRYFVFALNLLFQMNLVSERTVVALSYVPIPGFTVIWTEVSWFAFEIAMLLFLVLRTIRLARARAQAAGEMQAVKTLQGLLLARSHQPTPGYSVETVYRPASEVGGDFFLVSPGSDGSLVAVVGDVSGKGLLAAMRVSLILGALNRETSRIPTEVLARLNSVLIGQSDMGFTTACCVRVETNGDFSFANAGHLNPYIDGQEVIAPGALPLGLRSDQPYETVTGHLHPGQRLVLLSDGVPEARAEKEMLGFEKLVELTRLGAAEIADAAQQFGQEDDITVLSGSSIELIP